MHQLQPVKTDKVENGTTRKDTERKRKDTNVNGKTRNINKKTRNVTAAQAAAVSLCLHWVVTNP